MNRRDGALILLAGAGLVFSFPPFQTGFLALAALVPFFILINGQGYAAAFRRGYLTGFIWCTATLYWVTLPTLAGGIALVLYQPVYLALYAMGHVFFYRRWGVRSMWLVPFTWTTWEWLRSLGELAFPWLSLGYTQTYYVPLVQFASITGVAGVAGWVALINVLVYFLIVPPATAQRRLGLALALAGLVLAPLGYGYWVLPQQDLPVQTTVALLQGNIDPYLKWDRAFVEYNFAVYDTLVKTVAREKPQLVIWPETAAPCYIRTNRSYRGRLHAMTDSLGVPMLVGAPDYEPVNGRSQVLYYNAAFLLTPGSAEITSYNKIRLVPFSERLPWEDQFPVLSKIDLGEADFSRGREQTVFNTPAGRFGVLICFESIFPEFVRTLANNNTDFLITITNDGWFGRTSGPAQHAQILILRAIENRISIGRCANTGYSFVVDPYGRISHCTRLFTRAAVVAGLPERAAAGLFLKYGDLFSKICMGIVLGAGVAAMVRKWRRS
jgi:apolipoprotein N-acyltransferase